MPFVPARPLSLAHLSDEAASLALDKHLGDFVKAAKELNINRSNLRKLTWHNPKILNAAHERMWLFRSGVRSKITAAIYSGSAKCRRWGFDAMFDSYEFRDQWSNPALLMLAPASRRRVKAPKADNAQLVLEREAAAELDRERAAEFERELAFEMNGDRRPGQGDEETRADIEPARALRSLDLRDGDSVREAPATVSEEPTPELAPQSGLPVWPGPYAPLPLVAHLYAPRILSKGALAAPQLQRERGQEPRRRLSRGGWR
jgi:hypothetical protein